MSLLSIYAGSKAYSLIQDKGLQVEDIGSVFAASGAAKWLTISALDAAIFAEWLVQATQVIHLFGTSVGAWKLAAAAQANPRQALEDFAWAYCHQRYGYKISHADIQVESEKIINTILNPDKIQQILTNKRYRFHCGAVACRGPLASESKPALAFAMACASALNLCQRRLLNCLLKRVVFFDSRTPPPISVADGIAAEQYPLSADNFVRAISASGAIPYVMAGVSNIPHTPPGMYRDGGLIDYHPLPCNFWHDDKLILYPHFYSHITPGWFDKSLSWRRASAQQLSNVVLICPSQSFVASLPDQRIPDRQDFNLYRGRDDERIARWEFCMARGRDLGKSFLDIVNSAKLQQLTRPL